MENKFDIFFDVLVVGAGHAGIEAAHIAAKMGARTGLITIDDQKIGVLPCNPSIGGLGKGHIIYEVSALGGLMPKLCSQTYLQARMLNTCRGPAVQGLRLQIDKYRYSKLARETIVNIKNLTLIKNMVTKILWKESGNRKKITGVQCADGKEFFCKSIIITSGTYLNGVIYVGFDQRPGGKDDTPPAVGLTESIELALETKLGRLKTGTPPRLLKSSIDFAKLERQVAHKLDYLFEFSPIKTDEKQPCFIAHTNEKTHEIIKNNFDRSALFGGAITGIGPRYCPSIEDKIARFPTRTSHHVFIEPEGGDDTEVYPSGLSTSLPLDVQQAYIASIVGLEQAVITKPGYAIEYDFLQPNNLTHSLEAKKVEGLFFAGQINGTTGYEEAAGQGIMAGINAVLKNQNKERFILKRTESYIGVMIDDTVTLGVDEPYRMFTSRAERRLLLRQDNVFLRLMPHAHALGTVDQKIYKNFLQEKEIIEDSVTYIKKQKPLGELFKLFYNVALFQKTKDSPIDFYKKLFETHGLTSDGLSRRVLLSIHANIRYDGYITREQKEIEKTARYQTLQIPATLTYTNVQGLTNELQEKLTRHKPKTIAHAQLIPGMTPAAISLLIFQIKLHKKDQNQPG